MRKCGNKCLYRRVLAGALSVLLAVGTGACGGKAETGTGQAEVLTQGAEAGTGSAARVRMVLTLNCSRQVPDSPAVQCLLRQSGTICSRSAAWSFPMRSSFP